MILPNYYIHLHLLIILIIFYFPFYSLFFITGSSSVKSVASNDLFGGAIQSIFGKAKPSKAITVPTETVTSNVRSTYSLPTIPAQRTGFGASEGGDIQGLSRVLVWLMAPVAAEYLKYGRTVVSDPRRALKLLSVLEQIQTTDESSASSLSGGGGKQARTCLNSYFVTEMACWLCSSLNYHYLVCLSFFCTSYECLDFPITKLSPTIRLTTTHTHALTHTHSHICTHTRTLT